MTTADPFFSKDPFGDRRLWAYLLGGSLLAFILLKLLACGPGAYPSQTAIRTATFVVEALCNDDEKVGDCMREIRERAQYLAEPDGGRE